MSKNILSLLKENKFLPLVFPFKKIVLKYLIYFDLINSDIIIFDYILFYFVGKFSSQFKVFAVLDENEID
jgi:hypothetical protein